MSKPVSKTNPNLVDLIGDLKAQSRETGAPLWRDVALRLSKSRSNWAQPNLSRLSRHCPEGNSPRSWQVARQRRSFVQARRRRIQCQRWSP